ncbi:MULTISPECIES: BppU family phage baseplate upper protein [unclassified Mammaliicoccus]|uniref:BppU family phage baseplate upper protein n=1 Tax=unclassified Mammaliicoccus TaxID=2803851 RepID=UPI001EFA7D66|nr:MULTISPECIES: BppU family phage baseplate upper protein [unclassified Mammaliicoccus]
MAIYKNKDIEVNVNEKSAEVGYIDTNFYTEDKSTSSIRITIKNNKRAVDLSKTNLTPKLDLFHSDGSIFMDENINIVLPEQGIIQYKISDRVIKHPGKVNAKLFLKNETQSVHVANFNFTIKDSGITEAVSKEITINIVDDSVRRIIQENAFELLGDGFKDDVTSDLQNYVSTNNELFKGPQGDVGPQGPPGKDGVSPELPDMSNWQKYKLTNDNGENVFVDINYNMDVLHNLPNGFYYAIKVPGLPDGLSDKGSTSAGTLMVQSGNGTKRLYFAAYTNNLLFTKRFYSTWNDWELINPLRSDTKWTAFNLINGAETNAIKIYNANTFDCAYRTIVNGDETKKLLRINGKNLPNGSAIARLPVNFCKNLQRFSLKVGTDTKWFDAIIYI